MLLCYYHYKEKCTHVSYLLYVVCKKQTWFNWNQKSGMDVCLHTKKKKKKIIINKKELDWNVFIF